jgi:hypothetical protein
VLDRDLHAGLERVDTGDHAGRHRGSTKRRGDVGVAEYTDGRRGDLDAPLRALDLRPEPKDPRSLQASASACSPREHRRTGRDLVLGTRISVRDKDRSQNTQLGVPAGRA